MVRISAPSSCFERCFTARTIKRSDAPSSGGDANAAANRGTVDRLLVGVICMVVRSAHELEGGRGSFRGNLECLGLGRGHELTKPPQPHSQDWYAALQTSDYALPWTQHLLEVSGETIFDALLERHICASMSVLEAGCAGGRDAALYAPKVKSWTGYDFAPQFLKTARARQLPNAVFVDWHSRREEIPADISRRAPFDLIVSRRGPTSVIQHLPALAAENSQFVYVGPRGTDLLEEITAKLEDVAWQITWSAVVEAHGFLPSFEDYALRAEFNNQPILRADYDAGVTARGFPILETRCVIVATPV